MGVEYKAGDAKWDRMGIMMDRFHAYFRQGTEIIPDYQILNATFTNGFFVVSVQTDL